MSGNAVADLRPMGAHFSHFGLRDKVPKAGSKMRPGLGLLPPALGMGPAGGPEIEQPEPVESYQPVSRADPNLELFQ